VVGQVLFDGVPSDHGLRLELKIAWGEERYLGKYTRWRKFPCKSCLPFVNGMKFSKLLFTPHPQESRSRGEGRNVEQKEGGTSHNEDYEESRPMRNENPSAQDREKSKWAG